MRIVALAEATSFLALLVATYIKYSDDAPGGVQVLGPLHGFLFLAYVFMAINLRASAGWDTRTTLLVLLGACPVRGLRRGPVGSLLPAERSGRRAWTRS